jgi:large subunit ribosomal protein L31
VQRVAFLAPGRADLELGAIRHFDIDPKVHPAWTGGNARLVNEGGQVARFNKRFGGLSLGKK